MSPDHTETTRHPRSESATPVLLVTSLGTMLLAVAAIAVVGGAAGEWTAALALGVVVCGVAILSTLIFRQVNDSGDE